MPHNNPADKPQQIKTALAGSGTWIVRPHPAKVLSPPGDTSPTYKVHRPLGSMPLKMLKGFDRADPSKAVPDDNGSSARPSGCHCPVNCPLPLSVYEKVRYR